jgi:hypothetical protein
MIFARDTMEEFSNLYPSLGQFAPLNTEAGQRFLHGLIDAVGGVDVVIFDNVMSLIEGDQKDEMPWSNALPLVSSLTSQRIGQIWLDHTGHNGDRQYGSSTKAWRFDAVGILSPLPEDQRTQDEVAFQLSFEHPGKARRRTPENGRDFDTCIIRLREDQWTAEPAKRDIGQGKVSRSRVPFYDALVAAITATAGKPGQTTIGAWQAKCLHRGLIEPELPGETGKERSNRFAYFRTARQELIGAKWIAVEGEAVIDLKGKWA